VHAALAEAGDPAGRTATALIRGDDQQGAIERLEVYANAYFFRILECLTEDFGALRHCLGAELFHDLVTAYLLAHPPAHPSLRYAGAQLASFLQDSAAAAPFRRRCAFSPDLARLEWSLLAAFDAPDAPVVTREEIGSVPPDRWEGLRLEFQPALQCLTVAECVQPIRRAYDRGEPLPGGTAGTKRVSVCVWRREERVFHRILPPLEATTLERARAGARFGDLCVAIADACGGDAAPGHAAALLSSWQADGIMSRLILA